ncbi:hypothetical protein [Agrobacterium cavarae]|uniref:hypothetical protein n=1 Tax=Agrobacterium cavarae TaxID=2528239 RepID=UPI00289F0888|nr:hypothetical protein [Agrobacterium cavarae]
MSRLIRNQSNIRVTNRSVLGGLIMATVMLASMTLIFQIVIGDNRSVVFDSATLAAATLFVFCFVCSIYAIMSNSITLPEVLVIYFILVSASFSGFYEIATDYFPWPKVHTDGEISYAIFLYFLFALLFLVGNRVADSRPVASTRPVMVEGTLSYLLFGFVALSIGCMALSAGSLLSPRAEAEQVDIGGFAQLGLIGRGVCLTSFLFLWANWLNTRRHLAFLIFVGLLTVIWFNPIANPRFQVIGLVIAVSSASTILLYPTPLIKGTILTALFLLNYFVFGPLKSLNEGVDSGVSILSAFGQSVDEYAFRVDFDVMQVSANTVQYIESQGIDFGYNLLGAALFFVPRGIWPAKPFASSLYVHDYLRYEYINLSSPLPMEFYFAGGLIGVIVLSFIFGYFLRRLTKRVTQHNRSNVRTVEGVLFAIVSGYMPIMMRGSLNSVLPQFGFALISYGVVVWLLSREDGAHRRSRSLNAVRGL